MLVAAVFVPEHCVEVVQDVEHVCVGAEETVVVEQITVHEETADSEHELVELAEVVPEDVPEDVPEECPEEVTEEVAENDEEDCEETLSDVVWLGSPLGLIVLGATSGAASGGPIGGTTGTCRVSIISVSRICKTHRRETPPAVVWSTTEEGKKAFEKGKRVGVSTSTTVIPLTRPDTERDNHLIAVITRKCTG